jgi:trans-2,3-dihydro-3-hydroxyanthranilate isomerase
MLRYLHYDVFSSTPLAGNQLAVFPDAVGLEPDTMQRIALEMNFSETTFVFPAEVPGTDARVRIFTPRLELPMAGHPTIGTTFALVREGRVPPGAGRTTLGLGIGPTPVTLEWRGDVLAFAWMRQPVPEFGAPLPAGADLAEALSLAEGDLAAPVPPPQVVSCGVPFLLVPLRSVGAVERAELDRARWRTACAARGLDEHMVFLFAVEAASDPTQAMPVYSRMFGPVAGVTEDPGTGSASGPLGAYLVRHGVSASGPHRFVSRQGVKMRRPCEIHVRIEGTPDTITAVEVGGTATFAGEGRLRW